MKSNNPEIVIERGIAPPVGREFFHGRLAAMRAALESMQPGDSFVWTADNKHPYLAAKQVGCRITTRKLKEGGWRVWKVEGNIQHPTTNIQQPTSNSPQPVKEAA